MLSRFVVILALCALTVGIALGTGGSPVLSGKLPDTDDYMRMVQVFRWLDGAAWSDVSEPRMNPPAGVTMHWSRLPDLAPAAVVGLLEPWLGRQRAALVAAGIVPPVLLIIFLWSVAWMARPVAGRGNALLASLLAVLPLPLMFQFEPGRVDHDNWQLILATLALGAQLRQMLRPQSRPPPLFAAAVFALALWVGGESLPWLLAYNACAAVHWMVRGERANLDGPLLGATVLTILSFGLLLLTAPPALRWVPVCDGFGIVYASLPAALVIFWAVLWVAGRQPWTWLGRLGCVAACGAVAAAAFLVIFPECGRGPFSQVAPRLELLWRQHVAESQPLFALFPGGGWQPPVLLLAPLAAWALSLVAAVRGAQRAALVGLVFTVWLGIALALCVLEVRVLSFVFLFAAAPLVGQVLWLERRMSGWWRMAAKPLVLGLLGPVFLLALPPVILATSKVGSRPQDEAKKCDFSLAAPVLDDPAGLGNRSRLIAAPIHDGAEILFRTPHQVLGAPYHRNGSGNLDVYDFFGTPDPDGAHLIARRRGIDLVLFCPAGFGMWLPADRGSSHFVDALEAGKVPAWLRPLPLPAASHALLFQVVDSAAGL